MRPSVEREWQGLGLAALLSETLSIVAQFAGLQQCNIVTSCVQDVWVETDSHSCLKRCECPADGSACAPAKTCDAAHFACKAGWSRFSDGQAKCFQPGCQAGSLQEAVGRSVANGQAYALCTCSGKHPVFAPSASLAQPWSFCERQFLKTDIVPTSMFEVVGPYTTHNPTHNL